jgi:hypothetical protein
METKHPENPRIETKKPIVSTLKNLAVGEYASFPLFQFLSIRQSISRLNLVTKLRFTTKTEEKSFKVTRTE